jgi:hypothetical protein
MGLFPCHFQFFQEMFRGPSMYALTKKYTLLPETRSTRPIRQPSFVLMKQDNSTGHLLMVASEQSLSRGACLIQLM